MKYFYALLILLLPAASSFAQQPPDLKAQLKPFFGTYRGFGPTDESAVARGEMELTLNEDGLLIRMATGLGIAEDFTEWNDFENSVTQAIFGAENVLAVDASRFENAASISSQMQTGLTFSRLKEGETFDPMGIGTMPALIFFQGEISAIFGPSLLFSEAQVAAGNFAALAKNMDPSGKLIPTLANGGKAGAKLDTGCLGELKKPTT